MEIQLPLKIPEIGQKCSVYCRLKHCFECIANILNIKFTLTCESSPNVSNMTKNRTAQSGENGSRVMASGYAMKAKPGPVKKWNWLEISFSPLFWPKFSFDIFVVYQRV